MPRYEIRRCLKIDVTFLNASSRTSILLALGSFGVDMKFLHSAGLLSGNLVLF